MATLELATANDQAEGESLRQRSQAVIRGTSGEDPGSIWVGDDKGFRVVMDIEMVK